MMLRRIPCLIALVLVVLMTACNDRKVYRIGVSQCSQDDWRSKMNEEILREAMLHDNVEVEIRSADDSNDKQIADIKYFADQGFDIILVAPNEAEAVTPAISEVYDRGVPVLVFDRKVTGDKFTAYQGADNEAIGVAAANYARSLPVGDSARVIELYGLKGSTPAIERHRGFARGWGREVPSAHGNWNYDDALPAADSLLRLYPDVEIVYAHNDRMAIAAADAACELGLSPYIIGIDAAPAIGMQAVADSIITATFLYPTEGHRLIRTALSILQGEDFDRVVTLPVPQAVDCSNADILLLQNEGLADETAKFKVLKEKVDSYWLKHTTQTTLFYAAVVIVVLLFVTLFLVLRMFWQRKRHQKVLEEATQSKLVFFTNVSHDLRTPLTLIAEPVEQLAAAPNLTAQQRAMAEIARKNVKILKRLINQVLDFRKYENGKLDLNLTEVDFGAMTAEWLESFRTVARKRDIKLLTDVPADTPAPLALDSEKIERVFFNLISNAFKYTPDNGTITFAWRYTPERLTFSVADTGRGISADDLSSIFERFFQVDKVHPNGSGIGLSLAKAFVELHGGTIDAESEPGKGTRFTVTLPVKHVAATPVASTERYVTDEEVRLELDRPEPEAVAANSDTTADSLPTVLVIDDNADIRQLLSALLAADYKVVTAADGKEGLRLAAKIIPDLIISDVMMPVMDGLECCRALKNEVSTSHIPVLMLTACSMDEQRVQGYDSGADGYVSKPFSGKVLLARCRSLIENRKRIKDLWSNGDTPAVAKPDGASSAPADIDSDFYARFLEIFRAQMGNPDVNVDSLAALMGLGRSQFYRKIKALTNYSPVELMRHLRLKQARALLTSTDRTISEIAYEVGFSTPAYFTKCYREAFGETPSEVRERLGAKN